MNIGKIRIAAVVAVAGTLLLMLLRLISGFLAQDWYVLFVNPIFCSLGFLLVVPFLCVVAGELKREGYTWGPVAAAGVLWGGFWFAYALLMVIRGVIAFCPFIRSIGFMVTFDFVLSLCLCLSAIGMLFYWGALFISTRTGTGWPSRLRMDAVACACFALIPALAALVEMVANFCIMLWFFFCSERPFQGIEPAFMTRRAMYWVSLVGFILYFLAQSWFLVRAFVVSDEKAPQPANP